MENSLFDGFLTTAAALIAVWCAIAIIMRVRLGRLQEWTFRNRLLLAVLSAGLVGVISGVLALDFAAPALKQMSKGTFLAPFLSASGPVVFLTIAALMLTTVDEMKCIILALAERAPDEKAFWKKLNKAEADIKDVKKTRRPYRPPPSFSMKKRRKKRIKTAWPEVRK